jgi:hypothetical protein
MSVAFDSLVEDEELRDVLTDRDRMTEVVSRLHAELRGVKAERDLVTEQRDQWKRQCDLGSEHQADALHATAVLRAAVLAVAERMRTCSGDMGATAVLGAWARALREACALRGKPSTSAWEHHRAGLLAEIGDLRAEVARLRGEPADPISGRELLADVRSAVRDLGRLAMETEEEPVTVTVSVASPTTTGVEGALDVDVTVTLADGTEVEGEVTLARREHDGAWAAYGDAPDYWISGALLAQLHRLGRRAFRDACQEIESSAAAACDEYDAEAAQ